MKKTLFGLALLMALPAAAPAEDQPGPEHYRVRVEWHWWMPGLSSQVQKGFGDNQGTLLDLSDDLGVADENTWEVQGAIRLTSSVKLVGSYVPLEFNGRQNAPFNFTYGSEFFFREDEVVTNIKGKMYGAAVRWEFFRNRGGYVGALLGARVLLFDSIVLGPEVGKRVTDSETIPVPILGLTGRAYAGKRLSIEGTFAGLTIGSRGHLWDIDISGRVHFSDRIAAQAGYHRMSLEGQDDRDLFKMIMGGWTFGVELSL